MISAPKSAPLPRKRYGGGKSYDGGIPYNNYSKHEMLGSDLYGGIKELHQYDTRQLYSNRKFV